MTIAAQNILHSFKRLSDVEKKEVATEIVRLTLQYNYPPLSDNELVQNAEELFLELDQREAANA